MIELDKSAGIRHCPHLDPPYTSPRVKLVLLIRDLRIGGAERQLVTLAKNLDRTLFDVSVVCLYNEGEFAHELRDARVPVIALAKKGRWDIPRFLWRLLRVLRTLEPDILHSYLTVQNLLTILVKPALPMTQTVWGVRASNITSRQHDDWLAGVSIRLEALLSRFANLIIFNSNAGRDYNLSVGFSGVRSAVIPNGIDTERFSPDPISGSRMRASWQIPKESFLIGIVGRLDPMKDHATFLRAAAMFAQARSDARFVCIGGGPEKYTGDLRMLADKLGLVGRLVWSGFIVHDMPAAYNALDICCSSSSSEGTPNVVAEAMACGVPCVVTDVGDSRLVVGNTGIVVPPKSPEALAAGWDQMVRRIIEDSQLRASARERIKSTLSLVALAQNTSEVLLSLL
jgi:glycosyltransferase involved in cell wall biosynthesis